MPPGVTSPDVFGLPRGLQMAWLHTGPNPAPVIDLCKGIEREPVLQSVGKPVSQDRATGDLDVSVPAFDL